MVSFEKLLHINDRAIQHLLRYLSDNDIALALKGASSAMIDKIMRNVSKRKAEFYKETLRLMEAVPVNKIEQAQLQFLSIYRQIDNEMI